MITLLILLILISVYEIHGMWEEKQKKEIFIFVGFCVITLAFGYFYMSNPYRQSLSHIILSLLGLKF